MRRIKYLLTSDEQIRIKVGDSGLIFDGSVLEGHAARTLGWKGKAKSLSARFFDLLLLLGLARKYPARLEQLVSICSREDGDGYVNLLEIRRLKSFQGTRDIRTMKRDITNNFLANSNGVGVALQISVVRGRPEADSLRLSLAQDEIDCSERVSEALLERLRESFADEPPMAKDPRSPSATMLGAGAPAAVPGRRVDISRLPHTERFLFGRETELAILHEAWLHEHIHVVACVAWGGVGKSALVNHWVSRLAAQGYGGAAAVFGWSFYNQGTAGGGYADLFIEEALKFFGDPAPGTGDRMSKAKRLRALVNRQKTLLILDGMEPLQAAFGPREGFILDEALSLLLQSLAADMNGLCIVTTRPPFSELDRFGVDSTVREIKLDSLSDEDGANLLRSRGACGREEDLRQASSEVKGHALALLLMGSYVADVLGGDITRHRDAPLASDDVRAGAHARRIIDAHDQSLGASAERALLRILGLFDRPATADSIAALCQTPEIEGVTSELVRSDKQKIQRAVARLQRMGLLSELSDGCLDAHPLVRDQAKELLLREHPEGFREAHRRLYGHLQDQAEEFPATIEAMQPLYQAVRHGCLAGLHNEVLERVFRRRIRRGQAHYSVFDLGAFGEDLAALWWFFVDDWTSPNPDLLPRNRSWVLHEAAWALGIVGRRTEAEKLLAMAKSIDQAHTDFANEGRAIAATALQDIVLGKLAEARRGTEQTLTMAQQQTNSFLEICGLLLHAYMTYLEGQPNEAYRACQAVERAFAKAGLVARRASPARVVELLGDAGLALAAEEAPDAPQEIPASSPEDIEWYGDYRVVHSIYQMLIASILDRLKNRRLLTEKLRTMLALIDQERSPMCIAGVHTALGVVLSRLGHVTVARKYLDRALDQVRGSPAAWLLAYFLINRASVLFEAGDHAAAAQDVEEVLAITQPLQLRTWECDGLVIKANLALVAGDLPQALAARDGAAAIIEGSGYGLHRSDLEQISAAISTRNSQGSPP